MDLSINDVCYLLNDTNSRDSQINYVEENPQGGILYLEGLILPKTLYPM